MTSTEIRVARRRRGWSQFRLAAEAGVHLATVSMFERGLRLRPETLAKIVAALERPDAHTTAPPATGTAR